MRRGRTPRPVRHTPIPKATISASYTNPATVRGARVGAPIDVSSLIA